MRASDLERMSGERMSGGKGEKGGNFESLGNGGPFGDGRELSETGGNRRKPSAVLPPHPRGISGRICSSLAETAETPTPVPPTRSHNSPQRYARRRTGRAGPGGGFPSFPQGGAYSTRNAPW